MRQAPIVVEGFIATATPAKSKRAIPLPAHSHAARFDGRGGGVKSWGCCQPGSGFVMASVWQQHESPREETPHGRRPCYRLRFHLRLR